MSNSQLRWDKYFLRIVEAVGQKSKDPSTKVGCVIVGEDNQILSTGFNGFPRGVKDRDLRYFNREIKYKYIEHADRNAIYNAARTGIVLKDATMYLPWDPCHACTRAIIQSGIIRVVVANVPVTQDLIDRWGDSWAISSTMLIEADIRLDYVRLKESGE